MGPLPHQAVQCQLCVLQFHSNPMQSLRRWHQISQVKTQRLPLTWQIRGSHEPLPQVWWTNWRASQSPGKQFPYHITSFLIKGYNSETAKWKGRRGPVLWGGFFPSSTCATLPAPPCVRWPERSPTSYFRTFLEASACSCINHSHNVQPLHRERGIGLTIPKLLIMPSCFWWQSPSSSPPRVTSLE